jgi:antitoxin (DNA-binding transcriptional repressor) of toxin-antitoxin stability system
MFRRAVGPEPPSIRIRTDELRTVREAMRDFSSLLTELEEGEVEKLVLTQRNRMRAVVVSVERWSEVEQALAGTREVSDVQITLDDEPAPS